MLFAYVEEMQIARMRRVQNPIFSMTTNFHFVSGDTQLSLLLNVFNVRHEKVHLTLVSLFLVGAPAGYLKTRPSRGANQHNC